MISFLLNNPSIVAILFGIAAIFLFFQIINHKTNKIFVVVLSLMLVAFFYAIVILKSRVVWFGVVVVIASLYFKPRLAFNLKVVGIFLLVFILGVIVSFYYKTDSTLGRLLIYKIDFLIIKQHWLWGIHQPFNVIFNHTQANYFVNKPIENNKELLLASNGFFPFNEWFGIFIRFGILGFTLSIIATFGIIKLCLVKLKQHPNTAPAIGTIFFLLIVAMVSYPFHFSIYQCIFCCSVLYVLFSTNSTVLLKHKVAKASVYLVLISYFGFKEIAAYTTEQKVVDASALSKIGYTNNALQAALPLNNSIKNSDGNLLLLISKLYHQKNNKDSAIYFVELAHQKMCTDDMHEYWAECLLENRDSINAEKHYLLAINIMPCKFRNRDKLLAYYLQTHQLSKAYSTASNIIQLPEKIPSLQSAKYKAFAITIVDNIGKIKF